MAFEQEIPELLIGRIREVAKRPDEELTALNQWARENMAILERLNFDELVEAAAPLGMPKAVISSGTGVLISLLMLIGEKVSVDDVIGAVGRAGIDNKGLEKIRLLLSGLQFSNAEFIRAKGHAIHSGSPNLESVEVVTDLRAMFKSPTRLSATKEQETGMTKLLGLVPIGIVSLTVNDAGGESSTTSFELQVEEARRLMRTINALVTQLEELERSVEKITPQLHQITSAKE